MSIINNATLSFKSSSSSLFSLNSISLFLLSRFDDENNKSPSVNHQNHHEKIREEALNKIGSTWFYDTIFLFIFPPVGLAAFLGNLISYWILSGPYFTQKPLYTYLKLICLNSSAANLISMLNIIWNTRRYSSISNTEWASQLRCYLKIPVGFGTYFYGSVLDIVLALERLCELTNRREIFRQYRPQRVCFFLFLVCFFLNAPFLFVFVPTKTTIYADTATNTTEFLYHYGESEFALSNPGRVIKGAVYIIRDIITLTILITVNLISLIRFRRIYYQQSLNRLKCVESSSNSSQNGQNQQNSQLKTPMLIINFTSQIDSSSQQQQKQQQQQDGGTAASQKKKSALFLMAQHHENMRTKWHFSVNKVNNMLTKMVLIICALSTCEHLFVTLTLHFFSHYTPPFEFLNVNLFIFLANLSTLIKNSANVFIFYYFNDFYRTKFKNMILSFIRCRICFSFKFNMNQNI